MAESTLSATITEIRLAILNYLGMNLTYSGLSTEEKSIIDLILKRGLRQFYFPPSNVVQTGQRTGITIPPYEWSFLKPITEIDLIGSYVTGTLTVTELDSTVLLTDGVWPSWTATNGTLVIDSVAYEIASRTDDTHIELVEAWALDTEDLVSYTLRHNGNYDLPDDFGGIEGNLVHAEGSNRPDVRIIGEGKIRSLRATTTLRTYPEFAAIRPKKQTITTTGQRFEILFFPIPAVAYTLKYRMLVLPELLVDTTLTHPYGGAMHAETIIASCLAIAESQEDEVRGVKWQEFMDRLAASIEIDKKMISADFFGYNRDYSDSAHRTGGRRHPPTTIARYEPGPYGEGGY
ncbi:MAG: hypothetical protein JSV49_04310 [Thermoplasmata archaeon]|nr:MAG: hypothetical protein JSV49_04310 [Thermoplasmata archaeon]